MTHPTDALRLVPTRDDGLRVGRAILEAHSQWEKEHGVTGAQNPWQEQHIILLGQAAILAAPASPLPEGGGLDEIMAILREEIKCDATGLAPAVASIYLTGFDRAAERILALPAAPTGAK